MPTKSKSSRNGGPKSGRIGKPASTLSGGRAASAKPKTSRVSAVSERVIVRTSVKRREAMKALADR